MKQMKEHQQTSVSTEAAKVCDYAHILIIQYSISFKRRDQSVESGHACLTKLSAYK